MSLKFLEYLELGPFATDAAAQAGGVPVGAPYRRPAGAVAWRAA
jgi:hypothetical protein